MFASVFSGGVVRRAVDKGLMEVRVHDLRDYTHDRHRQVDDRPFGGLEGMVFKPEPVFRAVEAVRGSSPARVILLSPQGRKLDSRLAGEIAGHSRAILICGRYEGVDERVVTSLVDEEVSIGDYVLTGGEVAAAAVIEATARMLPGVVGKYESVETDSFYRKDRLGPPQYTRPPVFRGLPVPEVLLSGDHGKVEAFRERAAWEKTARNRPDLLGLLLDRKNEHG